jgi:hypothetical protein
LIHDRRIGEYYLPEGIVVPISQNLIGRLR